MMDKSEKTTVREMPQTFNVGAVESEWLAPAGKTYRAKVFKSGNSLALRLPKALGLEAGIEMELSVSSDGGYALKRIEPPKAKLDISGFWGKCPGLRLAPREDFEERPSAIAARDAARKAAGSV
jgi:antitoxin VapB